MSDASKAHKIKLANSRKRFKELQQLKKQNSKVLLDATKNDIQEQTSIESSTSSTQSSINVETPLENTKLTNSQLPTYFTNADYAVSSMFFDSLQQKDNIFNSPPSSNIENIVLSPSIGDSPNLEIISPVDEHSNIFSHNQEQIRHNADSQTIEDPDIRQNELFEHHRNLENNLFSEKNKQNLIDYFQREQISNTESNKSEVQNLNVSNSETYFNQMDKVPHVYIDSNSITDLEKRNIELTSYLDQERNQSCQYKSRINELETQINQLENQNQLKNNNLLEINKLTEDLHCHSQTIRLLVAEKTELSESLSQLETNLKTKNSECSELQARLKASRSRAFEFEQELNSLKLEKTHRETNNHDQDKIIENLKRDFDNLQDKKEELKQDLLEVTEKLKSCTEEKTNLLKLNSDLSNKLSLADIKIQQLSNANHQPTVVQVDQLVQEKNELEKKVETVNNILKSITKERDESTAHYQKYTEELNNQLVMLQEQYQKLQQENDTLSIQEHNRVKHISDLERQLQSIQNERVTFSTNVTDSNMKNELDVTKELCIQLQLLVGLNMKHNRYNKPNYSYSYNRPSPWAYDDYSYGRDYRAPPPWANGSRASSPPRGDRWRSRPPKRKQNGNTYPDAKKPKKGENPKKNGIQMFVTTQEFPAKSLTEEQLELLQTAILNEMNNISTEDFHPQFLDCFKRRGNLIIICNNQDSVDWLKKTVPTLNPWENAQCKALDPSEVPNLMDILITVPGDVDSTVLLRRIEKQNEDFETANWNLTSKKQDEAKKSTSFTFAVEESVVEKIKSLNYKLFINFSRIHVRYLGALRSKEEKAKSEKDEQKDGADKVTTEENVGEDINIDPEEIVGSLTSDELKAVSDAK